MHTEIKAQNLIQCSADSVRTSRSLWREFSELSGGVPKSAWTESDQKRMAKGELPKGHPEHPNI